MASELIRYEAARRALAEATSVDEVRQVLDVSRAFAAYAKQAKDGDLIAKAIELKERAITRLGELHEQRKKGGDLNKGALRRGVSKTPRGKARTLDEDGIDKNLAKQVRHAAKASPIEREAEIEKKKRLAVAVVENDKKVLNEDRAEKQQEKKRRRNQREQDLAAKIIALPDKHFGVIYTDPEWKDTVWSEETGMDRHASNHYPTSDAEVIASRPVASIAAKDCVLFMWTTNQHLRIAIGVMEAWGFEYKSNHCWGKDHISTGRWNRSKHELLLIGTRGSPVCPAPGTQWDSLIMAPRGEHSAKPECFLEMIEQYFPTIPKIELNRRGPPRPGWDAWGNEVVEKAEAA